jgi:hypothetical protein
VIELVRAGLERAAADQVKAEEDLFAADDALLFENPGDFAGRHAGVNVHQFGRARADGNQKRERNCARDNENQQHQKKEKTSHQVEKS